MRTALQSIKPGPLNFLPERGSVEANGRFGLALAKAKAEVRSPAEVQAHKSAEEFVGMTLVQPILTSLREQSDAAPPFAPGPGEKAFGPLLDAELAKRITQAKDFELIDVVARNLLGRRGATGAQEAVPHVR